MAMEVVEALFSQLEKRYSRIMFIKSSKRHGILPFYYPPEVNSMKYCFLGVFRKEYFMLVTNWCK